MIPFIEPETNDLVLCRIGFIEFQTQTTEETTMAWVAYSNKMSFKSDLFHYLTSPTQFLESQKHSEF